MSRHWGSDTGCVICGFVIREGERRCTQSQYAQMHAKCCRACCLQYGWPYQKVDPSVFFEIDT